jgi:nucleoid-associated protein YgaU
MHVRAVLLMVALIAYSLSAFAADITLVKHARRAKPLGVSQYVVKEGDTLRKILMDGYNAKEEDLPNLYKRFRQENPDIADLDYIPSGTKIVIPIKGEPKIVAEQKKPLEELEVREVSPNEYVIKQGEYLARIMRKVYGVSDDLIFHEYMALVKKLNPGISNPNLIKPGQKLILPDIKRVMAKAKNSQEPVAGPLSVSTTGIPPQSVDKSPPALISDEAVPQAKQDIAVPEQPPRAAPAAPDAAPPVSPGVKQASNDKSIGSGKARDLKMVKGAVLPALKNMGGTKRDKGIYYMPTSGGTGLSINTSEIPVMELDTGKKIIFDMNGTISPEVKGYIEKAFPSFTVVSGSQGDLEDLMDKVLSVSGYFSINKDSSPLLVGAEEKLRFFGKWIVYKDFSRNNVFVVNLLGNEDQKTPGGIRNYARHFGIDLIEIGGKDTGSALKKSAQVADLKHSYPALFGRLKIPYDTNKEIDLVKSGVVKITYKAPVLMGNIVLTDVMPETDMAALLHEKSYELLNINTAGPDEVLDALGLEFEGPPLKMTIAKGRTELEIPGIRLGNNIIILKKVDKDIAAYLAASGMMVMVW